MRTTATLLLAGLMMLAACRKREEMKVSREDAQDIPREVAIQKLKELLPTAESTACTFPKESYKASEVKEWGVHADGLRIVPLKERNPTLSVVYLDVTQVRLDKVGRYFQVRIFAKPQADPSKDFLSFLWRAEEPAKQVVELLDALRIKK